MCCEKWVVFFTVCQASCVSGGYSLDRAGNPGLPLSPFSPLAPEDEQLAPPTGEKVTKAWLEIY